MPLKTTLCYLEQNGCYLMLHRVKKEKDANKDKWIGVGGKFEPGETPEACALREVFEETGCRMNAPQYRGVIDFFCPPYPDEQMHLFTCTDFSGDPAAFPCDEGELGWVKKEDVPALPIWQGDKVFLRLLAEGEPFFRLELHYENGSTLARAVLNGREISF